MSLHHPAGATLLKQQTLMHEDGTHTETALYKMNHPYFPLPLYLHRAHTRHQNPQPPSNHRRRLTPRNRATRPEPATQPNQPVQRQTPPPHNPGTSQPRKFPTIPTFTKPNLPHLPGNTQIKVIAAAIAAGTILPILWTLLQSIT